MFGVMALEAGVSTGSLALDFSDALTSSLSGISADYAKYVLIAFPVGFAIWAAPKAIRLVMKFFNALTH